MMQCSGLCLVLLGLALLAGSLGVAVARDVKKDAGLCAGHVPKKSADWLEGSSAALLAASVVGAVLCLWELLSGGGSRRAYKFLKG